MNATNAPSSSPVGLVYGLAAYLSWGFVTLYFAALKVVPPMLVLGHRIVWSVLFLGVLIFATRQAVEFRTAIGNRRVLLAMLGSTIMIALNWYTFIWAVTNKQTVEASFGYFINPLVNVLLGVVVLKERLRPLQIVAIGLAVAGVGVMTWYRQGIPLVSMVLAVSFGMYGLIRKTAKVGPIVGLSIETLMLFPVALAYVGYFWSRGDGIFAWGTNIGVLLLLGGVITALPLIWFAAAARRLPLATLGFLQYVAPTVQLLIAVSVLGEAFTRWHGGSFGLIWLGLVLYSVDAVMKFRGRDRQRHCLTETSELGVPVEESEEEEVVGSASEPVARQL